MNILAVDYGTRFIGLALADDKVMISTPYKILKNEGESLFAELQKVIEQEKIGKIIIGRPLAFSGRETQQTGKTNLFIEKVREKTKLPVVVVDERLTSKMADKLLAGEKGGNHAVAASIILQDYLERGI